VVVAGERTGLGQRLKWHSDIAACGRIVQVCDCPAPAVSRGGFNASPLEPCAERIKPALDAVPGEGTDSELVGCSDRVNLANVPRESSVEISNELFATGEVDGARASEAESVIGCIAGAVAHAAPRTVLGCKLGAN